MRTIRALPLLAAAALLASCGGGGAAGSHALPAAPGSGTLSVHVSVPVAGALPAAKRRALFVSPSTQGISVTVTPHGATTPVVFQGTYDISSSSSLCTTSGSTRTCALTPAVSAGGPYDVAFATYDAAPVSGSFAAAKQLGTGTTPSVTVTLGAANAVGVSIGGVVAAAFVTPSVSGLRAFHTLAQQVAAGALDADGNLIITSGAETYVDANGNAVSIALAVTGAGTTLAFSPTSIQNSITPVTLTYTAAAATSTQTGSGFTATLKATPSNVPANVAQTPLGVVAGNVSLAQVLGPTGGGPHGIALGPDGNIWFTHEGSAEIGKITPGGTITEFAQSGLAGWDIAPGPDGNLWFTDFGNNKIGQITTSGTITEFAIGTPSASLEGITAGPDGNLWFTESAKVGRITPSGTVTEFANGGGFEIAAGPDGNLWFTASSGTQIGRITPAGVTTFFAVASASSLDGITAGPDGKLWFTDQTANFVGKITTSGVATTFTTGITGSPAGITSGPDGKLWFTELNVNTRIGSITTAGVVTEYAGQSIPSKPSRITTGADGNLWFTLNAIDSIGVAVL